MAKIFELGRNYEKWLNSRPAAVKLVATQKPPNRLYKLASTGQRVFILSYSESGTVTVVVSGEFNLTDFEREVFGINPNDLKECDLPKEGEVFRRSANRNAGDDCCAASSETH